MRSRTRELALCGLLALAAGCSSGTPRSTPTPFVSTSTSPSATPSRSPSASPGRTTVIGVLGDFGVDAAPVRAVVRLMAGWHPDAVVTTGDNAYQRGTPAQAAFARHVLDPIGAPVYAALGNHDEITSGGGPVMRAFGIPNRWYVQQIGPVQLIALDANRPYDPVQLDFLRRTLAKPRTGWRVVAFHQPAMSCSLHGPNAGVDAAWVPLFRGHVDLVLSGHNHTYERFAAADGTPYVTTGGGGATLYPSIPGKCSGPGKVRSLHMTHHAVRLTVTAHTLLLEAVAVDATVLDTVTLRR